MSLNNAHPPLFGVSFNINQLQNFYRSVIIRDVRKRQNQGGGGPGLRASHILRRYYCWHALEVALPPHGYTSRQGAG